MGPGKNSTLYEAAAAARLQAIDEEFERRNVSTRTMQELGDELIAKETTPDPVTEPTLYARLYVLTQVQRTQIGMDGLVPIKAVDFQDSSSVTARQAPHHDKFSNDRGVYCTRAIKLELPGYQGEEDIQLFGLNIYQPDISSESPLDTAEPAASETPSLVIIGGKGDVLRKEKSITGETVVFAAFNKRSGDVKFYTVKAMPLPDNLENIAVIRHDPENRNIVRVGTPDGQYFEIEQLQGDLLLAAIDEFDKALTAVKEVTPPNSSLKPEEREALSSALGASGES